MFLDEIERSRITRLYAVPTMLSAMLDALTAKRRDLSSLRAIGYGGGPAAFALIKRAMEAFPCDFYQTFGASEGGGFVTYLKPADHTALVRAGGAVTDRAGIGIMPCGGEVQGFHVRIVNEHGTDLSSDEVGEMWIRSESTMSGYWNRPQQTAEVIRDGWLASGDLAVRDAIGILSIADGNMIVSGGLNVYSSEVEGVLQEHSGVAEVAVVGVPDPHWGETVTAFVVPHRDARCTVEELQRICEVSLASFKRPKRFHFLERLPKTSTGKVRKLGLRKLAAEAATTPANQDK